MSAWYEALQGIESLGSQHDPVGGLLGCAAARDVHHGQFFTPPAVVRLLWHLLGAAMAPSRNHGRVSLLDSTCGSGRMFLPADPDIHELWGADIDGVCTSALGAALGKTFKATILRCPLDRLKARGMDVALINPPFSLRFDSPTLLQVPGAVRGRYGQHSSAVSQWYALGHALEAAAIVGAVLPMSAIGALLDGTAPEEYRAQLVRVMALNRTAFASEGAAVSTGIALFERGHQVATEVVVEQAEVEDPSTWPRPHDWAVVPRGWGNPTMRSMEISSDEPCITLPVTGNRLVRLVKRGRKIGLHFSCGLVEARVRNRVLVERVPDRPRVKGFSPIPRGVQYSGQGKLDLEVHLAQTDPRVSLKALVAEIRAAGGRPQVCPSLAGYFARAISRSAIRTIPMRQSAFILGQEHAASWASSQEQLTVALRCAFRPSSGPTIPARTSLPIFRVLPDAPTRDDLADPPFALGNDGTGVAFPLSTWLRFSEPTGIPEAGWRVVHEGLKAHVPHLIAQREAEARAAGVDRILSWGYQFDDAMEFAVRGSSVCGYKPGLGKSRVAIAMCLLGGRRNLIVVEARLIQEMVRELTCLGLPSDWWQVIQCPADALRLRRINLISYSRLRQPFAGTAAAATEPAGEGSEAGNGSGDDAVPCRYNIARLLRRRIHTLVADEAHCLRNRTSQQTRAVWMVSPKRVYDLSGTPIANYPRDILPLLAHAGGDGTAEQRYGLHHPFLESNHIRSMAQAVRGVDAFAEQFVTFEWVTNEFLDDLQKGAKREVPRIADVPSFRRAVVPHVKRRLEREPDVARHISYPIPREEVEVVPWDSDHLDHYLATVEEFASWYDRRHEDKRNNLAMILQKIAAVVQAANNPYGQGGPSVYRGGITSKERAIVARILADVRAGHKVIVFAGSPSLLNRIGSHLLEEDCTSVLFHGQIPIARRVSDMDRHFRDGRVPVLLGSRLCLQKGYNIPQADRVHFFDRAWLASEEEQCMYRVLRPQQKCEVLARYYHYDGSIDVYQAQMVAFKASATAAGLDYGDPAGCEGDFLHLESILSRFLDDCGDRYGLRCRRRAS